MNSKFRILIADDEQINIQVMTSALKDEYEIITALSGFEAISKIKKHAPDLILLDVMMPELSGFDVCSIIKSDATFADIPIIFLTALDSMDGEQRGLELGGADYLTKPINLELLKLRVRNQIKLKEQYALVLEQRNQLTRQNEDLEAVLARVKQLEGIIPICMYCKKIRDDHDVWNKLEEYITAHSEALFSHSICPDCAKEQIGIIKSIKDNSDF